MARRRPSRSVRRLANLISSSLPLVPMSGNPIMPPLGRLIMPMSAHWIMAVSAGRTLSSTPTWLKLVRTPTGAGDGLGGRRGGRLVAVAAGGDGVGAGLDFDGAVVAGDADGPSDLPSGEDLRSSG